MLNEFFKKRSHNKKWKGFDRSQYTHERPAPKTAAPTNRYTGYNGLPPTNMGRPKPSPAPPRKKYGLPEVNTITPMPKCKPPLVVIDSSGEKTIIDDDDDWPDVGDGLIYH